jgi:hypothetical protein
VNSSKKATLYIIGGLLFIALFVLGLAFVPLLGYIMLGILGTGLIFCLLVVIHDEIRKTIEESERRRG